MKYFPLITHAIILFRSKEIAQQTNVYAEMFLCFGPGNKTSISNIQLYKMGTHYKWVLPGVLAGGPIFTGVLNEELAILVQQFWKIFRENTKRDEKYDKCYRITNKVEELDRANV